MRYALLPVCVGLIACTAQTSPDPAVELPPETVTSEPLPFFGDGYRAPGDMCRRIGENAYTNQFLDDAADFVSCPEDMENLGAFIAETGASPVARTQGTFLFRVPRR